MVTRIARDFRFKSKGGSDDQISICPNYVYVRVYCYSNDRMRCKTFQKYYRLRWGFLMYGKCITSCMVYVDLVGIMFQAGARV